MSDFPQTLIAPARGAITTASLQAPLRHGVGGFTTSAWPSANLAIAIPFVLENPVTVYQISVQNTATINGTMDVGIYDTGGSLIVSIGSTSQTGANVIQAFNITDTALNPGNYLMAMSSSSTTATYIAAATAARIQRICGVQQMATAHPLPSTFVGAAMAQAFCPWISLHLTATV